MEKVKKHYPLDFKTMFGVSTMGLAQTATTSIQTSALMLFITDYSGIYKGQPGAATAFATMLLLVGRLFDAFINPPCGIILDRSPRTRFGKFKPYLFGGSIVATLAMIFVFNVPSGFSDIQKVIFICIAYIIYDVAWTLIPLIPITSTLSGDAIVRGKLLVPQRIVTTLVAMVFAFFITISIALGKDGVTPNMGLGTVVILVPILLLSLVGIAMMKEGNAGGSTNNENLHLRDIGKMFRSNKPLIINSISQIFCGFAFPFISAAATYYIKYAFGVKNFGMMTAIYGMMILISTVLGAVVAPSVLKKVTPAAGMILCNCFTVVPLVILWVINLFGPIKSPAILFGLLFIAQFAMGASFIPSSLLTMECMDYNKFKIGRSMEGLVSNIMNFIMNAQSALSAAITGGVLIAIGYSAAVYEKASSIPDSLFNGLGLVFFTLPALFCIISTIILFVYPLRKKENRDEMYNSLNKEVELQVK